VIISLFRGEGEKERGVFAFLSSSLYNRPMTMVFYNILLTVVFLPLLFLYLLRSWRRGRTAGHLLRRFFYGRKGKPKGKVHIHAVSVGELISLQPLLKKFSEEGIGYTLSTGTEMGYVTAVKRYGASAQEVLYGPFDLLPSVISFQRSLRPSLLMITEAEFWLNLFWWFSRRGVPLWVVNFRVADPDKYRRFRFYYRRVFRCVDLFFLPNNEGKEFLQEFGVPEERMVVSGNLKADLPFSPMTGEERDLLRRSLHLPEGKPLLVCGSTVEGEEALLLESYLPFRERWTMVLAPRHLERVEGVERFLSDKGLKVRRRSGLEESLPSGEEADVILLDTMGELARIYGLADLAFVGGSLVPHGGHNVLEPLFHGVATTTGPYNDNFKSLVADLSEEEAIAVLPEASALRPFLSLSRDELRMRGEKGKGVVEGMAGASDVILRQVRSTLPK